MRCKDGTEIDSIYLTIIDTASSWFEVVELPVIEYATTGKSAHNNTKENSYGKHLSRHRPGLVEIHIVNTEFLSLKASLNSTLKPLGSIQY
jgi:hypothetical protein